MNTTLLTNQNPMSLVPFNADHPSSVTLDQATQYHLSLNLEWLSGCQFNCKGCHVNTSLHPPVGAEISKLGGWLHDMETLGGYLPTIVFLGPTDFLTAANTSRILSSPESGSILVPFKRLSLQSTFLNLDNAEKIVQILKRPYRHMELELNFILEPEKIGNEKYLDTIRDNRNRFIDMLGWNKHISSFAIMNVYDYDESRKNDVKRLLNDYQKLHELVQEKFDSTIDFNFSFLRNHWWSNADVADSVRRISRIFDAGVDHEFNQTIRFSFGKLEDSKIEKHYNWYQNNLYLSPMIYERIVSFRDELKIPISGIPGYGLRETEAFEERLLVSQYESSQTKPDCHACQYQASCIDRNVITFMDMYGIENCIIARQALDAINVV